METEELEALCVWLRQHAPGYHLQYKIAADLIEKQAARIVELEAKANAYGKALDALAAVGSELHDRNKAQYTEIVELKARLHE